MPYGVIRTDFGSSILTTLRGLEEKCSIQLSKWEKILLAEVGTVEQVLSILVNSPIHVEVITQKRTDDTLERAVWLCDGDGKRLLFARSVGHLDAMPMGIVLALTSGQAGIGSILTQHWIETYRRIVDLGYDPGKQVLFRRYEILHDGKVWFEISEEFGRMALTHRD